MSKTFDPFRELERLFTGFGWGETAGDFPFPDEIRNFADNFDLGGVPFETVRHIDRVEIYVDLPGFDPATIDVTVEDRTISLSATRSFNLPDGARVVGGSRKHGTVSRTFRVDPDVDLDRINAAYDNGVLTLTAPLAVDAPGRRIRVDIGNSTTIEADIVEEISPPKNDEAD